MQNRQELKDRIVSADAKQIEDLVDVGLRHKGADPHQYLEQWLRIGRCFAKATKDDSWGEFEKLFAIIIKRMVLAERELYDLMVGLHREVGLGSTYEQYGKIIEALEEEI